MTYGLPYSGSKARIADWVLDTINPQDDLFSTYREYSCFVDVFFGGGAITHYTLLHRKFNKIIGNDLTTTALLFNKLMKKEIDLDKYRWISREQFLANRELPPLEQDQIVALCYSFGNDRTSYLYGKGVEGYKKIGVGDCEHIQRLNRVREIEKIRKYNKTSEFIAENKDYRELDIPCGSLVYLDPPYANSRCSAYYDESRVSTFDYKALFLWSEDLVRNRDCDVYMSERVAPRYFEETARKEFAINFRAGEARIPSVEKIFKVVPRERVKDLMPSSDTKQSAKNPFELENNTRSLL